MKKSTQIFKFVLLGLFLFLINKNYAQEQIAVIQSPNILLLDAMTGDIVDPSFIDLTPLDQGTPKAIAQVGSELWITDQIRDRIDRFDLQGGHLGQIGGDFPDGGLDNIRGLAVVNSNEVWVTNAGTNNGAPGNAIVRYDFDGNNLGFFLTAPQSTSPFDIVDNGNGEVYISYSSSNNIERRDYDGNFIANIVGTGVVSFIQQIQITQNNDLLAGVFSNNASGNNQGIYRFDISDGSILDYYSQSGLRGVNELSNGNILYTNSGGIHRLNVGTGVSTTLSSGGAQFFGTVLLEPCTVIPDAPTGDNEQTFMDGATLADIVIDPANVSWFETEADALSGSNPLPLSTVLVDGTTYYAVNIVDDCLSEPFAVTVIITLSTNDFDNSNFTFYPNPTDGIVKLVYNNLIKEVVVSNLMGQVLLNKEFNSNQAEIDLSSLPNAVYLIRLNTENGSNVIKVVKK